MSSNRVRARVDMSAAEVTLLDLLEERLPIHSRSDLLQQAYASFLWIVDEMLSGRRIISVDPDGLARLDRFKELSLPTVEPLVLGRYQFLVARPEKGRKQLYLAGRNMTVGQLVYKMRANNMTAEEAAADMDLPLEQVLEAQAYYQTHRDLIESEAEEEKRYLLEQGVRLEPVPVSG